MSFKSPDSRDYDNVRSLNAAFLNLMQRDQGIQAGLHRAAPEVRRQLLTLNSVKIERLAEAPFLIPSLHESDFTYWDRVLSDQPEEDLFRARMSAAARTLADSAMAFAWQLSRRDPYVLRVICCASLHWCERIAEHTLYSLLDKIQMVGEPLALRNAEQTLFWQKMLGDGLSTARHRRRAAHLVAMQGLLTRGMERPAKEIWSRAARPLRTSDRHVADDSVRD